MSKIDAYKVMPKQFQGYMNRYVEEALHESVTEIEEKAMEIYTRFYNETPKIGGGDNPMADNLYQLMTFIAYYEATDHRINEDSIDQIVEWLLDDMKSIGKIINFNKKFGPWIMKKSFHSICVKTKKAKAKGEWGNTWDVFENPDGHTEGASYVLVGCPLLAFAKANGYEAMMPSFCKIDHVSARLFHAKLIRFETEATGGSRCDYWYVGDQSDTARKYADLEEK